MAEVQKVPSPFWVNMFDNPPVDFDDTEEYEYVEYLEAQAGGSAPTTNQSIFRLYNRDIDPYLYFHKGVIHIRGYIATAANAAAFFNGSLSHSGAIALCNLGNYALFTKAELRLENTMIQKLDNPRHISLVKSLVRFCDDNVRSQGTLTFFYKDTGHGDASMTPFTTEFITNVDIGAVPAPLPASALGDADNTGGAITTEIDRVITYINALQFRIPENTPIVTSNFEPFNQGFVNRQKRCINQAGANKKVFELYIPLAYLFDFYDSNRFPFRGIKHEITLYRESNSANFLHRSAGAADGQFIFDKISMWVPRMKPSIERMADLDARFAEGAMTTLRWTDHDWFQSALVPAATRNYNWRVTSTQGRPSKAYVFFQLATRADGDQTFNKMIFDNLTDAGADGLNTLEVKLNSHRFPRDTLILSFVDNEEDYLRAYLMLLESQGKMLAEDTGLMISYEEFKTLYPLFVFDFTKIERRIYENISSAEIEVHWTLKGNAAADYYCFIILEAEKLATMKAVDQKLLISL